MELVSTMEISGEEREIADAYARGQIDGINSNLSQLSYSDDSGSRNLFNGVILEASNANFQNGVLTNTFADSKTAFAFQIQVYSGSTLVLESPQHIATVNTRDSISLTIPSTSNVTLLRLKHNGGKKDIYITIPFTKTGNFTISVYVSKNNPSAVGGLEIRDIQIEEGTTATPYEPYIPSVKMLAEEVSAQNDSLSVIGKCKNLLNPTLQTTTVNGVTCTANGDGTYTLNGTATEKAEFSIFDSLKKYQHLKNRTVKLVGCPKGGSSTTYMVYLQLQKTPWTSAVDDGEGSSVTVDNNDNWACWIRIFKGVTVSNLTFKPMITENLNATYDDFVPYTGDGETLTHDVAELKSDLSECRKKSDITTNETLIGTFNGKNYYRRLFTGIGASGSSVTVNVGEKIEIYNYYGRAYVYGQSGASAAKYPIPNKNYYIESQNISETSFQLTIPTSSDMRKVDLVIEYTKVDE